ncbi:MAG: DUF4270 domain-containing protein [Bacteroidales bacterium]|nr:DUF4270 domain-containing protein [Bacteroidales bacterium]
MKNRFISFLILLIITIPTFVSCVEDDSFGYELLPGKDTLHGYYDTSSLLSGYTIFQDSIRSDEGIYSSARPYSLLGSYVDPILGFAKADFLTELRLSSNLVDFGDTMVVDSLVLYLKIAEKYGEFRQFSPMHIAVYKLSSNIHFDSTYYSNINPELYYEPSDLVGSFTYYPSESDSLIRISIDTTLLMSIFRDTAMMASSDTFRLFMPGFYITSDAVNQGGQILSFDMLSTSSQLSLFYHYEADDELPILPASSTHQFNFLINSSCARINHLIHDYQQAWNPIQGINDSMYVSDIGYIQGLGGVKFRINTAGLEHWKDSTGIVIVKADLIIPVEENTSDFYDVPDILALSKLENDTNFFLSDQYHNDTYYTDYFDGSYYPSEKEYRFNIASHIQDIISGESENLPLILYPYATESPVRPNRVIINQANIQLSIQYMK